jgi:hypothetical protein
MRLHDIIHHTFNASNNQKAYMAQKEEILMFTVGDYVRTNKKWTDIGFSFTPEEGLVTEVINEKRRIIRKSCDKLGCAAFFSFEVTDEFETVQQIRIEDREYRIDAEYLEKDTVETAIQRILKFANWWYSNPETHFIGVQDRTLTCFNEAYNNTVKFNPDVDLSLGKIESARRRFLSGVNT